VASSGRAGALRRWAEALIIAVVVVTFGVTTVGIEGSSMEPSLHDGERALVPRYEAWLVRAGVLAYQPGDVVYFRVPGDRPRTLLDRVTGGPYLIKRVVAVAGDIVELQRGRLLVNGEAPAEPYLGDGIAATVSVPARRVPDAHVFVLGDNRAPLGSRDSRAFGPVPLANVSGRAALVLWPPLRRDHAGALTWNLRSLAVP
jgi:signal peptidase I